TDPFFGAPYEQGAFAMYGMLRWLEVIESRAGADISGVALSQVTQRWRFEQLRALPVIDLDLGLLGKRNAHWRAWIEHPCPDEYWANARVLDRLSAVELPVFHQSGWHDDGGLGTKLNYLTMTKHGRAHQKLTLGPWGHTDTATRVVGERDFGEAAVVDLQR